MQVRLLLLLGAVGARGRSRMRRMLARHAELRGILRLRLRKSLRLRLCNL